MAPEDKGMILLYAARYVLRKDTTGVDFVIEQIKKEGMTIQQKAWLAQDIHRSMRFIPPNRKATWGQLLMWLSREIYENAYPLRR